MKLDFVRVRGISAQISEKSHAWLCEWPNGGGADLVLSVADEPTRFIELCWDQCASVQAMLQMVKVGHPDKQSTSGQGQDGPYTADLHRCTPYEVQVDVASAITTGSVPRHIRIRLTEIEAVHTLLAEFDRANDKPFRIGNRPWDDTEAEQARQIGAAHRGYVDLNRT